MRRRERIESTEAMVVCFDEAQQPVPLPWPETVEQPDAIH
jgi:hypothetical protein